MYSICFKLCVDVSWVNYYQNCNVDIGCHFNELSVILCNSSPIRKQMAGNYSYINAYLYSGKNL